jgi:hypothetical protein
MFGVLYVCFSNNLLLVLNILLNLTLCMRCERNYINYMIENYNKESCLVV